MKRLSLWKIAFPTMAVMLSLTSRAQVTPPGAQTQNPTNTPAPHIQFAEPLYDFGKVAAGGIVEHDFVFTNTGDAPLTITGVYPACGCTTAGEWSREVAPGQTGKIPLQFNSAHYMGSVEKTATVVSNDKTHPSVPLVIKGTVWTPIEVTPATPVLNANPETVSNATATVHIRNNLEEPISLSTPRVSSRDFTADLKTVNPGKEFTLTIHTVPPLSQGTHQGTISIQTSTTNMPEIKVTALAFIQPIIFVSPTQIMLRPASTNPQTYTVSIRNNSAKPLTLSDQAVNAEGVNVQTRQIGQTQNFVVTATFPPGFEVGQGTNVELTMKTSSADIPVIKVPIHQIPAVHRTPTGQPMPPPRPAVSVRSPAVK